MGEGGRVVEGVLRRLKRERERERETAANVLLGSHKLPDKEASVKCDTMTFDEAITSVWPLQHWHTHASFVPFHSDRKDQIRRIDRPEWVGNSQSILAIYHILCTHLHTEFQF